ncbi:MAG TPA: hypothetical protein VK957_02095 [Lunatimonas sp.]|nr:hypothetical protein [Lunatimonas sp.]
MVNFKKFSLLICFFLIVNQDIIGNRHFDENQEFDLSIQIESPNGEDIFGGNSTKSSNFLHLPHTSIYLK